MGALTAGSFPRPDAVRSAASHARGRGKTDGRGKSGKAERTNEFYRSARSSCSRATSTSGIPYPCSGAGYSPDRTSLA